MSTVTRITGDLYVAGNIIRTGEGPTLLRTDLTQESLARFKINPTAWRTWDAMATNLPGTAANDDLALVTGTLGTHSPTLQTGDLKTAGATTRYAACTFEVPYTYVAGETITVRAHAGMKTTVADTSATIDFQVYLSDDEEGVSADLCTTAAQSINSLTDGDKDFQITAASVGPGDTLHIRVAITVTDGATGTAVIGMMGGCEVLLDVK